MKPLTELQVAFDSQVTGTEELTLDKEGTMVRLVLIGGSNCC